MQTSPLFKIILPAIFGGAIFLTTFSIASPPSPPPGQVLGILELNSVDVRIHKEVFREIKGKNRVSSEAIADCRHQLNQDIREANEAHRTKLQTTEANFKSSVESARAKYISAQQAAQTTDPSNKRAYGAVARDARVLRNEARIGALAELNLDKEAALDDFQSCKATLASQ